MAPHSTTPPISIASRGDRDHPRAMGFETLTAGDAATFAIQLAMGFALAACVGLRTFLPLFAAGLLARFGYVDLGDSFEWMSKTPALIVFGSAVAFEVLADKVPGLDHALHLVESFVK